MDTIAEANNLFASQPTQRRNTPGSLITDPPPRRKSTDFAYTFQEGQAVIQLIYEVNPLLCRCGGTMLMIAIIAACEQPGVVDRNLTCLDDRFEALKLPARPPPTPEPELSESSSDCYFM